MTEVRTQHLEEVGKINKALTNRRNSFITKYKAGQMGSRALTYEPALDREVYQTLKTFENGDRNAYEHAKNNLNGYTTFQVETFIGERLHVGLSSFRYDLKNGVLYGHDMDEPLLHMIGRGRECRDEVVKDVDKPRQEAEQVQFGKIQEIMGNPEATLGTTVISITPPGGEGSTYAHNFYDVFTLHEGDAKDRFVSANRFSSTLSLQEYKAFAESIDSDYFNELQPHQSLDSYFLSHPLVISDTASPLFDKPEEIHAVLHKDHEFLSTEDFGVVKRAIAGLIMSYVNTLCNTPSDKDFLNLTLDAVMNKADEVADDLKHPTRRQATILEHTDRPVAEAHMSDIRRLGVKPVRKTTTGCGFSGGMGQDRTPSNMSSSSSADSVGKDSLGNRTFNCPECGQTNVRPYNQTIPNCQHCGSEKVAC